MGQQRNNKETRYPMQQNMFIQQTIQNSCIKYDLWNIYILTPSSDACRKLGGVSIKLPKYMIRCYEHWII
jgi:hypothetical protein